MCTLLAGNLFISLAGSEEQINFSQQCPKMFKIASDIFFHAFLLFLGLFLNFFRWVPLEKNQKIKTGHSVRFKRQAAERFGHISNGIRCTKVQGEDSLRFCSVL